MHCAAPTLPAGPFLSTTLAAVPVGCGAASSRTKCTAWPTTRTTKCAQALSPANRRRRRRRHHHCPRADPGQYSIRILYTNNFHFIVTQLTHDDVLVSRPLSSAGSIPVALTPRCARPFTQCTRPVPPFRNSAFISSTVIGWYVLLYPLPYTTLHTALHAALRLLAHGSCGGRR